MRVVKAPHTWSSQDGELTIFLGGSIEMGKAEDWQARLTRLLRELPVLVLNPRRDDWDSTWAQTKNNIQFRKQVEWELDAQERAAWCVYYFSPGTQSPITLLELGVFGIMRKGRCIVCCPDGFWRKGNVDIVCERYQIEQVPSLEAVAKRLQEADRITGLRVDVARKG